MCFYLLSDIVNVATMESNTTGVPTIIHTHCGDCRRLNCTVTPDDVTSCAMTVCTSNCGLRFHSCKSYEHKKVCQKEKVPCINKFYGCPIELARDKIPEHLPVCPASVIQCSREWNRWPMHSSDKGWKTPMPFSNPHVKCGQFDVALAMRDQTTLMESFKTPARTRKILRNPLNQQYPAVPINSPNQISGDMKSSTSDASLFSDDDTGTPWDLNQSPPGLQQAVRNQLLGASRQATESLTKALDYVTGKQGLQRLNEISKERALKEKERQQAEKEKRFAEFQPGAKFVDPINDVLPEAEGAKAMAINSNNSCDQGATNSNEDELDIYVKEKKLFEVLGVDLRTNFISAYYTKPPKMFTFLCGQELRRDEYPWHIKNFHTDIQCNLDNWYEQRCPLSYAGCTFSFQRFRPKAPKGFITHNSILQSLGLRHDEEVLEERGQMSPDQDDDIRTEMGRKKLREATPEIHTSHNCESTVKVIPRYRSMSRETSPHPTVFGRQSSLDHCPLTSLPFEILQKIALHLDGFSLCNLSMTCHMMQNVCCTLLEQKGIVSLVWEKSNPKHSVISSSSEDKKAQADQSYTWRIAYKVSFKFQLSNRLHEIVRNTCSLLKWVVGTCTLQCYLNKEK